jgi:galactokinase
LAPETARDKSKLFLQAAEALIQNGVRSDASIFGYFVPGRLEVLGKHTDYAGGRSLVMALERGFCVIVTERNDEYFHLISAETGEKVEYKISGNVTSGSAFWQNYPATVIKRIAKNFGSGLKGCDIAFVSDLPQSSGMSSSSAFMIAVFLAMAEVNKLSLHKKYQANIKNKIDLSEYLASIENGLSFRGLDGDRGVGTFGGSEDHTAILNCKKGYLSEFSFCPIQFKGEIPLPSKYTFVIAFSGVTATKTGDARAQYNRAVFLVKEIVKFWNLEKETDYKTLNDLIKNTKNCMEDMEKVTKKNHSRLFSHKELIERFKHFFQENYEIIPQAIKFLRLGEIEKFGATVDDSQKLTEDLLKNQISQTIFLASSARNTGAVAASAFGAGFGGSVWALVECEKADIFVENWKKKYRKNFPKEFEKSEFFTTLAGHSTFKIG